jgi:hypothetical protein
VWVDGAGKNCPGLRSCGCGLAGGEGVDCVGRQALPVALTHDRRRLIEQFALSQQCLERVEPGNVVRGSFGLALADGLSANRNG